MTPKYEPMTEAEIEDYLDALYAEWVAKHEAYEFENNYEPFETRGSHAGGTQHAPRGR